MDTYTCSTDGCGHVFHVCKDHEAKWCAKAQGIWLSKGKLKEHLCQTCNSRKWPDWLPLIHPSEYHHVTCKHKELLAPVPPPGPGPVDVELTLALTENPAEVELPDPRNFPPFPTLGDLSSRQTRLEENCNARLRALEDRLGQLGVLSSMQTRLEENCNAQETRIACLEERIRQLMKDLAQRDSELRQLLGQKKDEVSHEEQCAEMEARTGGQIGAAGRAGGRDREDC